MSKPIANFFSKVLSTPSLRNKFKPSITPGDRIVPSRTPKNDAAFQLRIDAGETVDDKLNVVLQVNKQATSPALKSWLGRHSTHAKLATGSIPVQKGRIEPDALEEALAELEAAAKKNINE